MTKKPLLALLVTLTCTSTLTSLAYAEDCTGSMPGVDCTLDEDTTAPLTINNTTTLTIGADVTIGHTIDGDDEDEGTIETDGGGRTIIQNAHIGRIEAIDSLTIGDGDQWTTTADIITNDDGTDDLNAAAGDIDLGIANGGEILNVNNGATLVGQIAGHANDVINFGADLAGGDANAEGVMNDVTLNLLSGTLTLNASVGASSELNSVSVANDTTLYLNGGVNNVGSFDLDGTAVLGSNATLSITNYTADANNGRYVMGISREVGSTETAVLSFTAGGPVDLSGAEIALNLEAGSELLVTEVIEDFIIGNGAPSTLPAIEDTSFLFDYELVASVNNHDLHITRADLESTYDNENNARFGRMFFEEFTEPSGKASTFLNNLSTISTRDEYNELLESVQPPVDNSLPLAAQYVTNETVNLAAQRLAYLRNSYSGPTGISTGTEYGSKGDRGDLGGRAWIQTFASTGTQDIREGIDGYDLTTTGIAAGLDTGDTEEDLVLGVGFTYAYTDTHSNNASRTQQNIRTYQLTLYGSHELDNGYYVNAGIGYGNNDVSSERENVGGTGVSSFAQYDAEQYFTYIDVGKDIQYTEKTSFTPSLTAQYQLTETENYIETGADELSLLVNPQPIHSFEIGPKFTGRTQFMTDNDWFIIPEVSLGYTYDFASNPNRTVAQMSGSTEFEVKGFTPQRHKVTMGTGVSWVKDDVEFKLNYDYLTQSDLTIHSGYLRGAYKF